MMDAVEAVEKSYQYLVRMINFDKSADTPKGLSLEEVEKSNDSNCWKVTFSFENDSPEPEPTALAARTNPFLKLPRKTFRVVTVDAENGSFVSLKAPES